jgi:methionine synthase / methylenetetrahydrofolate reductase(NADPH)
MDLVDELNSRVLCGDGAMGTLLLDQGVSLERCLEEICVSDPQRVLEIYEQYIGAGARVIETNTFGANAVRLERFGFEERVAELNGAAARLAMEAARSKDVYVAGSVGPLGISADETNARGVDRAQCFRDQIEALRDGGVHLIFFETFMDFAEMEIALHAAHSIGKGMTMCSFACAPEGRLSSGVLLTEAFARLRDLGTTLVGVNCMNGPQAMVQLLQRLPAGELLAAYPNAGYPKYVDGRFIYHAAPEYVACSAREMVAEGAHLVGGCCGTNPMHIAAISAAIADLKPVRSKPPRLVTEPVPERRTVAADSQVEESLLDKLALGKQ